MPASRAASDMALAADPEAGVGLYVHWPYCERICPYCDFNVRVTRAVDNDQWRRMFRAEMSAMAAIRGPSGKALTSIYFGGGTPSLMSPGLVSGVVDDAAAIFGLADGAEVSLEANPTSAEATRFAAFRDAGVTRLSLGIQAFDDAALRFLGREHTAREARTALALARTTFRRTTFDLIYGLPDQSPSGWEAELETALKDGPRHLSLYQLTIEAGTAFAAAQARGTLKVHDDDTLRDFYDVTRAVTSGAGLFAYEVSNHAAAGEEGRHNLTYWRYGEYIGIGPGAHGRLVVDGRRTATECERDPRRWLAMVDRRGHGIDTKTTLDAAARGIELLLMNLRLSEGIPAARFAAVSGGALEGLAHHPRVVALREDGLLRIDDTRLAATAKGRPVLNALVASLVDAISW